MAMMKYGRTMSSPKTTDPKTGARIADPNVSGTTVENVGGSTSTYSSWPEFREMYNRGDFNTIMNDYKARGVERKYPKPVMDYIQGKTNKLSEEYDEPIIKTEKSFSGVDVPSFDINYKPGSKMYKNLLSQQNAEIANLKANISKKDFNALMSSVKGQSPEGSIALFSTDETQRKYGATLGSYGLHPSNIKKAATKEETPSTAPTPTPTEPPKPKKEKVTSKVVEKVDDWKFETPKYTTKTVKRIDKSASPKNGGADFGLRRKIGESGKTSPALRTVETKKVVSVDQGPKRERKLWETYEVGSYKGQNFRGMTEEQLRGLTKQARQDKKGAMFEKDFKESKASIKPIKQARKYAGRENVAGLASVQEKVTPQTIYESKVWTGQYKDESGKIYPDRVMKTDEKGNLSPINQPITNKQGEKIVNVRDNPENKKYESGFYALKKGGPSKNTKFTTEYQYGYAGSDEWKEAGKSFRSSIENATNRNSLQSKIVTSLNRQKLKRQNRRKGSGT